MVATLKEAFGDLYKDDQYSPTEPSTMKPCEWANYYPKWLYDKTEKECIYLTNFQSCKNPRGGPYYNGKYFYCWDDYAHRIDCKNGKLTILENDIIGIGCLQDTQPLCRTKNDPRYYWKINLYKFK